MSKNLTDSDIHRQNILNNPYALEKIQAHFAFQGHPYAREVVFAKADWVV